jgi:CubicO group peptidase (beta-lactamase class C family)
MRTHAFVAALAALGVAACSSVYSLDYVARVLTHQDANTDDYLWKRSVSVPASTAPQPLPVDATAQAHMQQAFEAQLAGESVERFMARTSTQSLLVAQDGRIVLERYADGVTSSSPQPVFSVSKSILSLLVARAVEDGVIRLDEPVTTYLPELRARDARFASITLAHLIDMRSGIAFEDDVSFPFITGDAPLVYYATDLRQVVLTQTRIEAEAPGPFHYNDYNPNLLALALERAAGRERLAQMRSEFWDALGAEDPAMWSADNRDFPYWESGFVATPRDLAKVGQLMLASAESTLLPRSWRQRTVEFTPTQPIETYDGRQWSYRGGWWLILRPDGRHDIAAIGRFSQLIYVSPANNIVIVRTGRDEGAPEDGDTVRLFYALSARLGAEAPLTASAAAP